MLSTKANTPLLLYVDRDHCVLFSRQKTQLIHYAVDDILPIDYIESCLKEISLSAPLSVAIASPLCSYLSLPVVLSTHTWQQQFGPLAQTLIKEQQPQHHQRHFIFRPFTQGWKKTIRLIGYPKDIEEQLSRSTQLMSRIQCTLPAWAYLSDTGKSLPSQYLYGTLEHRTLTWIVIQEEMPVQYFQETLTQTTSDTIQHSYERFCFLHPEHSMLPLVRIQEYPDSTEKAPLSCQGMPITIVNSAYHAMNIKSASLITKASSKENRIWTGLATLAILALLLLGCVAYLGSQVLSHPEASTNNSATAHSAALDAFAQELPLLNMPVHGILTALRPSSPSVIILQISTQFSQQQISLQAQADSTQAMFDYVDHLDQLQYPYFQSIELISHQGDTRTRRILFTVHITMTNP